MIQFKEFLLDNGLKVILHQDENTSLVSLNMLYDLGSKHESRNLTGIAHFLEHMMFSGTSEVLEYDDILQQAGGENNAYTNKDYTCYYSYAPLVNLELLLFLEADRMQNIGFYHDRFEVQKRVILEEFNETVKTVPYGNFWHEMGYLCYPQSQYEWPTIGKNQSHIKKITRKDLMDFYQFMNPQNAILCVTGNFDYTEAEQLIRKHFDDIAPGPRTRPVKKIFSNPTFTERSIYHPLHENTIFIAFHIPGRRSKSHYIYDLITDILALGKSSRLYDKYITRDTILKDVNAWVSDSVDKSLLVIEAKADPHISKEKIKSLIYGELEDLYNTKIEASELDKIKNKIKTNLKLSDVGILNKALSLSFYNYLGNTNLINTENDIYQHISSEQIQKASRKLFQKHFSKELFYQFKPL